MQHHHSPRRSPPIAVLLASCVTLAFGMAPAASRYVRAQTSDSQPAQSESPDQCSLAPAQVEKRLHDVQLLLRHLVQPPKRIAGGYRLVLPTTLADEALRFLLLERRCCPGVSAVLTIPDRADAITFVVRGPASFLAEFARLLPLPAAAK